MAAMGLTSVEEEGWRGVLRGGSAEEACRAATIGESLNQDGSEIVGFSCTSDTLARLPSRPGLLPSGSNRF
jgi:hypothetical protein